MTARRPLAVLLATVALGAGLTTQPDAARADAVRDAQQRFDALQGVARDTTDRLVVGTRKWEADQARLVTLQRTLRNTRKHVLRMQGEVDRTRAQAGAVGRNLFMGGGSSTLQLAFTQTPDQVLEALRVQHGLAISAGNQAQVLARAETARHRLQVEEDTARRTVEEATALTSASARRLKDLQALADRTAMQLTRAQDELDQALQQRADRLAAVAAARAASARERASRSRVVVFSGAACTGKSTSGQANGNLDPGSLCPLWMAPGHRLRADAAAAFNAMSQYHASSLGSPLCVTDSYRSYSEQASLYRRKPGLAAVPGSSNHGWGLAVDFCGGIEDSGSSAHQWMKDNAPRFGWFHPSWAEPSGNRPEPWHWEFNG